MGSGPQSPLNNVQLIRRTKMLKNVRSIAGAYAYCEEMIRRGKPDGAFKS